MSGSQAVETAVGLVLMFFLVSIMASAAVEIASQVMKKRSRDLERVITVMIDGPEPKSAGDEVVRFKETTTYRTLAEASRQAPSYMSAKAFGDAVFELLATARQGASGGAAMFARLPEGLKSRLRPTLLRSGRDLNVVRADLEGWFDDTMDRSEGTYKRWAQVRLFVVGLAIAVAANASVFGMANRMWNDPVTRVAVSNAANQAVGDDGEPPSAADLEAIAKRVDALDEVGLPIGWGGADPLGRGFGSIVGTVLGWVALALLVTLGAPFWFDYLTRRVSLRTTGRKPPRASEDPGSATSQLAAPKSDGSDDDDKRESGKRSQGPESTLFSLMTG